MKALFGALLCALILGCGGTPVDSDPKGGDDTTARNRDEVVEISGTWYRDYWSTKLIIHEDGTYDVTYTGAFESAGGIAWRPEFKALAVVDYSCDGKLGFYKYELVGDTLILWGNEDCERVIYWSGEWTKTTTLLPSDDGPDRTAGKF